METKIDLFKNQTTAGSKTYNISEYTKIYLDFVKTGVGTCKISFYRSLDGVVWSLLPMVGVTTGLVLELASGTQPADEDEVSGVDIDDVKGSNFIKATISDVVGVIDVTLSMGVKR